MRRAARDLRTLIGSELTCVVSSPYRRAVQTAEIVVAIAGATGLKVELDAELACGGEVPLALVRRIVATGIDTLIVGHQPTVELLVRNVVHGAGPFGFRTGMIVALDRGPPWRLGPVIDPHR